MRSLQEEPCDGFNEAGSDTTEPIAVIGLAAHFAKDAHSVEGLWEVLLQSRSTWSPVPKERFDSDAFYHPDPEHGGTFHVQGGHFLSEDPVYFDSSFFSMTKNEVLTMDPQQRLVMENVYHAIENAGVPLARAIGSNTSVYVSGFNHDYLGILNSDPETTVKYKPTGISNSIISNRVSWFFDFKGPSMTIDTACSSSLVALHLAVQSLRSRESTMSVVSGVNILENPIETVGFSHHGLLGHQGRSFSFDSRAEGYARGEGAGTVILKPLKDAVRDGDIIRAIIRETGVNQDGRTPGITVPSGEAQKSLIRQVYHRADLDMRHTRYIEAHGTGTRTGDPIEVKALAKAFDCSRDEPLLIGSVKSSLGHTEGSSGVASLIKCILILESGIIPATHDLQTVNPEILAKEWNIDFPSQAMPWPTLGLRRLSVNSFGIGGTNAHCVLDDAYNYLTSHRIMAFHNTSRAGESDSKTKNSLLTLSQEDGDFVFCGLDNTYDSDEGTSEVEFSETPVTQSIATTPLLKPVQILEKPSEQPHIFILTAFDRDGIKRNSSSYARYVKRKSLPHWNNSDLLQDLSLTLSQRRSIFPWKSFVMANTPKELHWNLSEGNFTKPIRAEVAPNICFVFTGQGAQYSAMGKSLLVYPVFRKSMEEASEYLQRLGSPWSLLEEQLYEGPKSRIDMPEIAQPLCTVLQIALIELLASWKLYPTRVIGHSSGEIAAAYCAGKISRESAWKVAYLRGRLSSNGQSTNGRMMAVGLTTSQLKPYIQTIQSSLQGELKIACYNSPTNNTVAGDAALIDALEVALQNDGVLARKVKVQMAYHSSHMERFADEYLRLMGCLNNGQRLSLPHQVHMFSTLTGKEVADDSLSSQYWVDNMISSVRFSDGLNMMVSSIGTGAGETSSLSYVVEIGPHSTLQSAIKETLSMDISQGKIKYQAVMSRSDPTLNPLLSTVGFLAASGCEVNIHNINTASSETQKRPARTLVDLPSYSFNHTERIIYESRLSKNLRFRKFPRHDLFGAPVPDWDSDMPRWRHFVRLEENPWIKHHMITGNYVYPGVGYLVMAVEASRQLAGEKPIAGFQLRQVSIPKALVVPDNKQGIEVCISMTTESSSELKVWRRFQISSYNETSEDWTKHCTGLICVNEKVTFDFVGILDESYVEAEKLRQEFKNVDVVCDTCIDFSKTYDDLGKSGLNFGTLFRNLHDVKVTSHRLGRMAGMVTVPNIAEAMPKQYAHSHLIHPATMDSMIHMIIAAVLDFTGQSSLEKIRLPTSIQDMWVSADLVSTPGHRFEGYASVQRLGFEKFEGHIRLFDSVSQNHCISMKNIELTPLETGVTDPRERKISTRIVWNPDVNFLDSETACALSKIINSTDDRDLLRTKRLQMASTILVIEALAELEGFDVTDLQLHHRRFYDWMLHVQRELAGDRIIHMSLLEFQECIRDESSRKAIFEEVEKCNAEGALVILMGRNIAAIMRQEVDPLQLMFGQEDLMEEVYKSGIQLYNLPHHLRSHMSLLRHQHSRLRILEIGGGTGSVTHEILNILSPQDGTLGGSIASYTFTDISSGFFEKAKGKFHFWKGIMEFQTFDLEKDPAAQGFNVGTYDLIIAGNVIHVSSNLVTALGRIRTLLRPGGQLIMQEGIRQDFLWYPLAFGSLPGWWFGSEDIRQLSPYIPVSAWDSMLMEAGFSGVDIEYPSNKNEDLSWQSIMISTALREREEKPENVYIISSGVVESLKIAESIAHILEDTDTSRATILSATDLSTINLQGSTVCISLLGFENKTLDLIEEIEYLTLKNLLMKCQKLLWVTPDSAELPSTGISTGLLRSIRSERDSDGSNLVTLSISDFLTITAEDVALWTCAIAKHQFYDQDNKDRHAEYLLRDNIIHIARLREFDNSDNFLASRSTVPRTEMTRISNLQHPVRLGTFRADTGDPRWVRDLQHKNALSETQVQIETHAVGLVPGFGGSQMPTEAAGIVTAVGSAVKELIPGDNVVFLISGSDDGFFQTCTRVEQAFVVKLDLDIPLEIAASLPAAFLAVSYGLGYTARLSSTDTVLIHDGSGTLGQIAIQYAKVHGAKVYATVSSASESQFLNEAYGIPQGDIFSNNDLSFCKGIMRCTNGAGVDVIFNTLKGERQRESLSCLSAFGQFVNASGEVFQPHSMSAPSSVLQGTSIFNIDIDLLIRHRPSIVRERVEEAFILYVQGKLKQVVPLNAQRFSQIQSGMMSPSNRRGHGKTVFIRDPSDLIPVVPESLPPLQFDHTAAYVLAGGLGGLGRSIARWMVTRGAKNLIFLSRSNVISEAATRMISDLDDMGCMAHVINCDIADRLQLEEVFRDCDRNLPPIKGCIQCSMVLQDGTFEGMSFEAWNAAIRPKVQGSCNLHNILPSDLNFFVMLSSVAGIFGNRGQANYAAGNTFQDALAAFRTARGMKASVIDLGSVSSVGWVAENRQRMTIAGDTLFGFLHESDLHNAIEFMIDPRHDRRRYNDSSSESQLILGLPTAELCHQHNLALPPYLEFSLFTHQRTTAATSQHDTEEQKIVSVSTLLAATTMFNEAVAVVSDGIVEKLSALLAIPVADIDRQRFGFGFIDSLVAMEFRFWIKKELGAEVSVLDVMGAQNIQALSEKIVENRKRG